jgi:DNA integrity scanning protein DisA with diadenylate cyclase activity
MSQTADQSFQAELERLAYSAYLLTVDPGVAFSVVMTAIDGSIEESIRDPGLLERTIDLSLQQLRRESSVGWDGESSVLDTGLYGHSAAVDSPVFQSLKDLSNSPILLLDSSSRIAFVLHHVLGYKISEAAAKTQVSEKQYRARLRQAYVQLATFRLGHKDTQIREVIASALA